MTAAELLGDRDTPALRARLAPIRPERVKVRLVPRLLLVLRLWPRWVAAMTMPWAIYLRPDALTDNPVRLARLICHELVHVRQWRTHGLVGFLRHYLTDYTRGRMRRMGHRAAYRAISLEAEAYDIADHV